MLSRQQLNSSIAEIVTWSLNIFSWLNLITLKSPRTTRRFVFVPRQLLQLTPTLDMAIVTNRKIKPVAGINQLDLTVDNQQQKKQKTKLHRVP